MWLGGAILGCAAHFVNVIKDMDQDRQSAIKGLPQRIGKRGSIAVAALLVLVAALIIF